MKKPGKTGLELLFRIFNSASFFGRLWLCRHALQVLLFFLIKPSPDRRFTYANQTRQRVYVILQTGMLPECSQHFHSLGVAFRLWQSPPSLGLVRVIRVGIGRRLLG